jgi:hypothetical protein
VRAVLAQALRNGRNPTALFVGLIKQGAHRSPGYAPKPCKSCGSAVGHEPGCPRGVCPECEVGGGRHVEGCSRAGEAA